jgi:hypothetical protein
MSFLEAVRLALRTIRAQKLKSTFSIPVEALRYE